MKQDQSTRENPPKWAQLLFRWICASHLVHEIENDLDELFRQRIKTIGLHQAKWRYIKDVLSLMTPSLMKEKPTKYPIQNHTDMIQNFFKVAIRNLLKNRTYSTINIAGLSIGMTTALLISLWVWDELTYNTYHKNYNRVARVMQHQTFNGNTSTTQATPLPMRTALQNEYASEFERIALSSWTDEHILAFGEKQISQKGNYVESAFPLIMSFETLNGSVSSLDDPNSIVISESTAKALFGKDDPINKTIKVDNKSHFKVTGVFENIPYSSEFHEVSFLLPWKFYAQEKPGIKRSETNWGNNSFQLFVQIAPRTSFEKITTNIEKIKAQHAPDEARFNPRAFLHPMNRWHLYSEWENGISIGGRIQFVWLFGIIGGVVLLLACINFMNLATARSQKRTKEVGIRKAIGSVRIQLIIQFLTESLLVATTSFVLAIMLAQLFLPWFNQVADKQITFPWADKTSWLIGTTFTLLTGLLAGSYPAIYLSGIRPLKALKGSFSTVRFAALPRQTLIIVQFSISVTLIIGTLVVLRQIQYAKNRSAGFDKTGLISVAMNTPELKQHSLALAHDLIATGAAADVAMSSSPTSEVWGSDASFNWQGKDPNQLGDLGTVGISHDYGKTVGWKFKQGRDFSRNFSSDSLGMVVNESAAKFMGLKKVIGTNVQWNGDQYTIIGIIDDVITGSPFMPIQPTVFMLKENWSSFIHIRLNPATSTNLALEKLKPIFKKYNPGSPITYKFASDEYDKKFDKEERIFALSTAFTGLAIFISCLGIFGLATFFAEQRQKEIGIRKVLGATVGNLWQMLSKDFLILVIISCLLATPLAYYMMNDWLQTYTYRINLDWWIFATAILGALGITLVTVSFQTFRAALGNPVRVLKNE